MENKILYTYRGIIRIGYNIFFSLYSTWPFSKIQFLDEEIVVKTFPFKKRIPYSKIKKLIWSYAGFVKIEHTAGGFLYVAFRCWGEGNNSPALIHICKILKSKGIVWEEIKNL